MNVQNTGSVENNREMSNENNYNNMNTFDNLNKMNKSCDDDIHDYCCMEEGLMKSTPAFSRSKSQCNMDPSSSYKYKVDFEQINEKINEKNNEKVNEKGNEKNNEKNNEKGNEKNNEKGNEKKKPRKQNHKRRPKSGHKQLGNEIHTSSKNAVIYKYTGSDDDDINNANIELCNRMDNNSIV